MAAIQESFTFQSAVTTDGNGTAADVSGMPGVCVQVEGITTASVIFEGRIGTLTYTGIQAVNLNDGSIATLTTTDGLWYIPAGGLEDVRCRVNSYSGGTITVIGRAIYNPLGITLADIDVAGVETVGIDQTTPGTTNKVAVGDSLDGPGEPVIDSYTSAVIDLAASTADQQIIAAPGADKQIWVYGFGLLCDTAAGTVVFQDEDDTALTGTMAFSDEGGISVAPSGNFAMPIWKLPTNKALEADTGACTVDGWMCFAIISV